MQANLALFLAAPDLLTACKAVSLADRLYDIRIINVTEWNAAMRLVDAALALANGGAK